MNIKRFIFKRTNYYYMKRKIDENLVLVGTNHVSEESSEEIKEVVKEEDPDLIGIELDSRRFEYIKKNLNNDKEDTEQDQGFIGFIKNPIGYSLSYVQSLVSDIVDTEKGTDMETAVEQGIKESRGIVLLDRDIKITMNRLRENLSFIKKLKLFFLMIFSVVYLKYNKIRSNKSKIKNKMDKIEEDPADLLSSYPDVKEVLVDERDEHIANTLSNIRNNSDLKVVAVIGMGHIEGVKENLEKFDHNSED